MSWYPKAFGSGTSVEGSICIFEHFWLREKAGAIDKGGRAHKSLGTLGWACGLREKAGETRSYRQGRMCSTSPLGLWEEQVVSVSWQLNEYYFWSDLHTRVPTAFRISVFVQKSVFCPGSIALKLPFWFRIILTSKTYFEIQHPIWIVISYLTWLHIIIRTFTYGHWI